MQKSIIVVMACLFLTGCHPKSSTIEPDIKYYPQERLINRLPSHFPELTSLELSEDWGKELKIGIQFGREMDLYRAITAYKRALFLIPRGHQERIWQIEYSIILSYYLGSKYDNVIATFEDSQLKAAPTTFPVMQDLVIILQDSYRELEEEDKAEVILNYLEKEAPEKAQNLELYDAIQGADFSKLDGVQNFVDSYCCEAKSVRKAQLLNAVLPGAGYYYVGQKSSAMTSFMINASFIAASWYFFDHGNYGAGIITSSLEFGWYFGGINGAGLAAKEWNQHIYNIKGKELMIEMRLFPVLMLEASF